MQSLLAPILCICLYRCTVYLPTYSSNSNVCSAAMICRVISAGIFLFNCPYYAMFVHRLVRCAPVCRCSCVLLYNFRIEAERERERDSFVHHDHTECICASEAPTTDMGCPVIQHNSKSTTELIEYATQHDICFHLLARVGACG